VMKKGEMEVLVMVKKRKVLVALLLWERKGFGLI